MCLQQRKPMRKAWSLLRILPVTLAALICASDRPSNAFAQPRLFEGDRIVFAGDSITFLGIHATGTAGWILQFQERAERAVPGITVTGSGIPGNTSADLLKRFSSTVLNTDPTVVVIWIGTNDIGKGLPISETVENFYQMLRLALGKQSVREVILVSPECVGEDKDGKNPKDPFLDQMATIIQEFASSGNSGKIYYCPMRAQWRVMESEVNPMGLTSGVLTIDGVHPNVRGNKFLGDVFSYEFGLGI
jgi:lysophospholipase L1-like esterase